MKSSWFWVLPMLFFSVSSPTQEYDKKELEKIYRDANLGNPKAQLYLGSMYGSGKGVPLDHAEAAKWYRKAAEQGYARAQWYLGRAYYNGVGLPRDYAEAEKWYRKAADQGLAEAQNDLNKFSYGKGAPSGPAETEKTYRKAAEQGNAEARMETLLLILFFPFLLFIFWGPFAFVYAAKVIIKQLSARFGTTQTIQLAFLILAVVFLPVGVTSKGGNIPAIFPWWLAVLGIFTQGGIDFSIASFIFAVPFVPVTWFFVSKEVYRQEKNIKAGGAKSKA